MLKVLGASVATRQQIKKYFQSQKIEDRDYLIDLYMQYGVEYNIEYELAIAMALVYTNFFRKNYTKNNLCGIGPQFTGTKLESFDSEEECIKAQYQILRIGADYYYKPGDLLSVAANNLLLDKGNKKGLADILRGNIDTISAVYDYWNYKKLTAYTLEDLWRADRDMSIIRTNKTYYGGDKTRYFFVVVGTATKKENLYSMKQDLVKLGFKDAAISVDAGFYRLEIGKVPSEKDAAIIKTNLSIFGYSGTIKYRDTIEYDQSNTQGARE